MDTHGAGLLGYLEPACAAAIGVGGSAVPRILALAQARQPPDFDNLPNSSEQLRSVYLDLKGVTTYIYIYVYIYTYIYLS